MKKNKLMRIASVLLVATMLSTSVISGTFAKYVTTDEAEDAARVAKFGVVASVQGDLYAQTYLLATAQGGNLPTSYGENTNSVSIDSTSQAAGDKVVAPGTANDKGMAFAVKGTPEVSTKIHFDAFENQEGKDKAASTISLTGVKGYYGVMIPYDGIKTNETAPDYWVEKETGKFVKASVDFATSASENWYALHDLTNEMDGSELYQPVKYSWTLTNTSHYGSTTLNTNASDNGNLLAAYTAIHDHFDNTTQYPPNTVIDVGASLTWAWEYGKAWKDAEPGEFYTANDKLDTILGDMIVLAKDSSVDDFFVVVSNGAATEWHKVAYKSATVRAAGLASPNNPAIPESSNQVLIAYDSTIANENVPNYAFNANGEVQPYVLAVLEEYFGGRIIVEQVD